MTAPAYTYGTRYYDPSLGRFVSADTIVPKPQNPQAFNRYAYVLNNPLRYTDPSGFVMVDMGGGFIVNVDPSMLIVPGFAEQNPDLVAALLAEGAASGVLGSLELAGPLAEFDIGRIQFTIQSPPGSDAGPLLHLLYWLFGSGSSIEAAGSYRLRGYVSGSEFGWAVHFESFMALTINAGLASALAQSVTVITSTGYEQSFGLARPEGAFILGAGMGELRETTFGLLPSHGMPEALVFRLAYQSGRGSYTQGQMLLTAVPPGYVVYPWSGASRPLGPSERW